MLVLPLIAGTILEPVDDSDQLFNRFLVGELPFFCAGRFGVPQDTCLAVTAGPGDERSGTAAK